MIQKALIQLNFKEQLMILFLKLINYLVLNFLNVKSYLCRQTKLKCLSLIIDQSIRDFKNLLTFNLELLKN
jgi:hypothetical protein